MNRNREKVLNFRKLFSQGWHINYIKFYFVCENKVLQKPTIIVIRGVQKNSDDLRYSRIAKKQANRNYTGQII